MGDKTKILIVDGEKDFAESLSDILEVEGYETAIVNTGEDSA